MLKQFLKFSIIVILAITTTALLDKKLLEIFYSEHGILFNLTSSVVLSLSKREIFLPNWNIFLDNGQIIKEFMKLLLTLNLVLITVWVVDGLRSIEAFVIHSSELLDKIIQSIFNVLISIWIVVLVEIIIISIENQLDLYPNLSRTNFYSFCIIILILIRIIIETIRSKIDSARNHIQAVQISELSEVPYWFVAIVLPLLRTFLSILFATCELVLKLAIVVFLYKLVQTYDLLNLVYISILYLISLLFEKLQHSLYVSLG